MDTVSKKKYRFEQEGFSLDLTYITGVSLSLSLSPSLSLSHAHPSPERILAMGFPSESLEGQYRNPMSEVQRFFNTRHAEHYWV